MAISFDTIGHGLNDVGWTVAFTCMQGHGTVVTFDLLDEGLNGLWRVVVLISSEVKADKILISDLVGFCQDARGEFLIRLAHATNEGFGCNAKFILGLAQSFTDSIDSFWYGKSLVHGQFWGKTNLDIEDILQSRLLSDIVSSKGQGFLGLKKRANVVKGLQIVQKILTVGRSSDMVLELFIASRKVNIGHGCQLANSRKRQGTV